MQTNIAIVLLILLLSLPFSAATEQRTDCYPLAVEYQQKHGGDLIFIQPLKESGAFNFGKHNGHWMNKAYSKERGTYYYDAQTNGYFKSKTAVSKWYLFFEGKKSIIYNVNQEAVPFSLIR